MRTLTGQTRLTEMQESQIKQLHSEGVGLMETAKKVGCGKSTVDRKLREWGLQRQMRLTDEQDSSIITEYNSGIGQKTLAKKFGVTQGAICLILKRAKVVCRSKAMKGIPTGLRPVNRKGVGELSGRMLCSYKKNARIRNLEWSVSDEYLWNLFLAQNKRCRFTGENLIFGSWKERSKTTASLDRIDSKRGYVEGNLQWIHKSIQTMKWDKSDSDFINWCEKIVQHARRN